MGIEVLYVDTVWASTCRQSFLLPRLTTLAVSGVSLVDMRMCQIMQEAERGKTVLGQSINAHALCIA